MSNLAHLLGFNLEHLVIMLMMMMMMMMMKKGGLVKIYRHFDSSQGTGHVVPSTPMIYCYFKYTDNTTKYLDIFLGYFIFNFVYMYGPCRAKYSDDILLL